MTAPAGFRPPGNGRLIAAVHACRKQVAGLDHDDAWRDFLRRVAGADSLRAMDGRALGRVLDELHKAGAPRKAGTGAGLARASRDGRPALDDRPQVRKARALWIELAKAGAVRDGSEAALEAFAKRVTGKARLAWCRPADLNKLIEALKDWQARDDANDPVVRVAATLEPHVVPEARCSHDEETRDQALVRALWSALAEAGAFRTGIHARLDTWLARNFGVGNTSGLDQDAAHQAVRLLGTWLRKVTRGKAAR